MRHLLIAVVLVCLCVSAGAQVYTVPPYAKTFEGRSWHFKPYNDSNMLFQQVADAKEVGFPTNAMVMAVAFRHEAFYAGTYLAKKLVTQVALSTPGTSAATMSSNPVTNRGPDYTIIFPRTTILLPAATTPIYPWRPVYTHKTSPLVKPWIYKGKGLLVEVKNYDPTGNTTATYNADRFYQATAGGLYGYFGVSCPVGKNQVSNTNLQLMVGGRWSISINNASATSGAAMNYLGASCQKMGPLTLPFDLTFLGMKGCWLYISLDLGTPVNLVGGSATVTYPIPPVPGLAGMVFYSQWFVLDRLAPGGMTTSHAFNGLIGMNPGGWPIAVKYAYYAGNTNPDTDPTMSGPYTACDTVMLWK